MLYKALVLKAFSSSSSCPHVGIISHAVWDLEDWEMSLQKGAADWGHSPGPSRQNRQKEPPPWQLLSPSFWLSPSLVISLYLSLSLSLCLSVSLCHSRWGPLQPN